MTGFFEPKNFLGEFLFVFFPFFFLTLTLITLWFFLTGIDFFISLKFGIYGGGFVGLTTGLGIAYFFCKEKIEVQNISYEDGTQVRLNLGGIGYQLEFKDDDLWGFKPTLRAGYLAGRIYVIFKGDKILISGPSYYVRQIEKRLSKDGS